MARVAGYSNNQHYMLEQMPSSNTTCWKHLLRQATIYSRPAAGISRVFTTTISNRGTDSNSYTVQQL